MNNRKYFLTIFIGFLICLSFFSFARENNSIKQQEVNSFYTGQQNLQHQARETHEAHELHESREAHGPPVQDFLTAKRLAKIIHRDHRETFYCGCQFNHHYQIDLGSCGYEIQEDFRRANRLEWEHIVPISQLAMHLPCWREKLCCKKNGKCYKGRRCCQEIDSNFAKMEGDLHNLVPEIGELNALRSNFRFGMLPFIPQNQFGRCEIKIDPETRRVEPRPKIRGMIARAYLYMSENYDMNLSDSQRQLFVAWNKQHPPEAWEIEWNKRIHWIQGNSNTFIADYEKRKNEEGKNPK